MPRPSAVKAPPAARLVIRVRGGFGHVEELAWQAERCVGTSDARLFYRRLGRIARNFHVQLNRADDNSELLLPDACAYGCPEALWQHVDQAAREADLRIPTAAIQVCYLAMRGELSSGRIEVSNNGRSVVVVPTVKLTSDEKAWIDSYGPAIESE